ncbi:VanZ family protein [Methylobacterium nonmethylotrophicum]|uniref:VanZ family protein n=1 Tax=Methylobacterium nonmethylotrophicum TaxID=1141884 RepID=A0A4Z0NQV9_9HYPH|nr:VanZ family protein [Methylobacterium nonmethylotrophicum]TGD98563.1 VanZ family protein [Methylobacterium nonmethylotrophicum]
MSRASRILGWLILAAITLATIAPIGYRPISGMPVSIERFGAFAVLAFLLALGYPRHRWQVLVLTVAAAGALEAFQLLEPTRHGRVTDFMVKVVGCGVGAAASLAAGLLWPRIDPRGEA